MTKRQQNAKSQNQLKTKNILKRIPLKTLLSLSSTHKAEALEKLIQ
jgi:hypothetical protein